MGEAVKSIRDRMVKFYAKDDNTITLKFITHQLLYRCDAIKGTCQ